MSDEVLNMSDEDFLNDVAHELENDPDPVEEETTEEVPQAEDTTMAESEEDDSAGNEDEGDDTEEETEESDEGEADSDSEGSDEGEEAESEEDGKDESSEDDGEEENKIDYEAFYKQITAPFKANGKDMQVGSVDDALQLMQMGAGFNKRMAALKPGLKSLRLLEKHGLLSEEKLNFLIDVNSKDPKAIARLLKDSEIDPLDLNMDESEKYQATTRTVADSEIELSSVLDDLKESEHYLPMLDVVNTKWDESSKVTIAEAPQLLNVIHDHMASGVYDVIQQKVESEKTFGRLKGLSDLEAYRQTGDAIQAQGGFDHLFQQEQGQQIPAEKKVSQKNDQQKDTARKAKKRAAGSTKVAATGTKSEDLNPLRLSDEEFMKQFNPDLL